MQRLANWTARRLIVFMALGLLIAGLSLLVRNSMQSSRAFEYQLATSCPTGIDEEGFCTKVVIGGERRFRPSEISYPAATAWEHVWFAFAAAGTAVAALSAGALLSRRIWP